MTSFCFATFGLAMEQALASYKDQMLAERSN